MKNVKVFISQPIKDKIDEEIIKEREQLIECAKEHYGENIEVIDSFFKGAPHDAKPLWFLGESIKKLSEADVAIFAKGYEEARGCRIENECCVSYGITVIEDYR